MYRTYILPIAESNSILWLNKNILLKDQLEKIQRKCTRIALRNPINHDHPDYLSYEGRLIELNMLKQSDRTNISAICYIIIFFQSDEISDAKTILNNSLYDTALPTRNRRLFSNIRRYAAEDSPIHQMMKVANEYHESINLDESIEVNRGRVKSAILNSMTQTATQR